MAKKYSSDYTKIITQLTDRIGQVVFAFDLKKKTFLYLNSSFETMWNRGKEAILKNPLLLLDTLHPEEKQFMKKSFQELLSGQSIKDVEFRILWPDKTERSLCLSPFVLGEQQAPPVIAGFVDDIISSKQHSVNIKKFAAKKDAVLKILSHNLAAP